MTRLNQILALERDAKSRAMSELTKAHHLLQRTAPLSGIARTYQPKDDEGDQLPPESTSVQVSVNEVLAPLNRQLARMFDLVATKENTNCKARANVVVDGQTLLEDVPATVLLFLEKQLVELYTFVRKLPTLDPAETWEWDNARNCYVTAPTQTVRTKKIPRNHVLAAPTDKHPAQVEMYQEDVPVGTWTTTKFSGALPAKRVAQLVERVTALQAAVKSAREEANVTTADDLKIGETVLDHIFAA